MNLKGRRVLVTGSEGFIGSHLVEKLVNIGAEVTALVKDNESDSFGWIDTLTREIRSSTRVIMGDILEYEAVKNAVKGEDVIFHLAAINAVPCFYYSPSAYMKTNIEGTGNVIEACLENGIDKVICTSSGEVYGEAAYSPIDEKHPLLGNSPYSASKIGADKLVECFFKCYNVPAVIVRPFDTYGPRQSARAVVPNIISQIYSRKKTIRLGCKSYTRDFTYVKDMANAFIKIAESDKTIGEIINTGCGNAISLGELAESIVKISGRKIRLIFDKEEEQTEIKNDNKIVCDGSKVRSLTGWMPLYSMEAGLEETMEWFKRNIDMYSADMYNT